MKNLSWFIFLMIPHLYLMFQNIPKFPIATDIIHLWNRSLPFENVSTSPFFSFISLSGFRVCSLYMSVAGVVIFDELWACTGIDIWVNTVLGPVYGDTEVNPDAILTYSEHMFVDIHGNDSGAPYEVRLLYSCLLSSGKGYFCSSLSKDNTLDLC